jgi:hypothetical protein
VHILEKEKRSLYRYRKGNLMSPLGNRLDLRMWRLVPLCVMWCLWREQNACSFEDNESGMIELRKLALHTLFSWSGTWSNSHESTFSDSLKLCKSFSN